MKICILYKVYYTPLRRQGWQWRQRSLPGHSQPWLPTEQSQCRGIETSHAVLRDMFNTRRITDLWISEHRSPHGVPPWLSSPYSNTSCARELMFVAWSWRAVLLKVECRGHSTYIFRNAELQAHPRPAEWESASLRDSRSSAHMFIWKKHCLGVGFCVSELTSASLQLFSTGLGFALGNHTKWCCPLSCMGQVTVMVNIFRGHQPGLGLGGPSPVEWAVQRGAYISSRLGKEQLISGMMLRTLCLWCKVCDEECPGGQTPWMRTLLCEQQDFILWHSFRKISLEIMQRAVRSDWRLLARIGECCWKSESSRSVVK